MKHTKSMKYEPSAESRELYLYATNNGDLYRSQIQYIENNLRKKMEKGIFGRKKAVDAFYYAAENAAKMYKKDFGYMFNVTDRYTAAVDMCDDFILCNVDMEPIKAVKIA